MRRAEPLGAIGVLVLLAITLAAVGAAVWRDRMFVQYEPTPRRSHLKPAAAARRPEWLWALDHPAQRARADLGVFLVVATIGVGVAALGRPGRLRGRGGTPPGLAAGAVGAIVAAICLLEVGTALVSTASWARLAQRRPFTTFFMMTEQAVQGAVLGAWIVLAVSRTWRPRPDDPGDRLGRLCGWGWVGMCAYRILYPMIWT